MKWSWDVSARRLVVSEDLEDAEVVDLTPTQAAIFEELVSRGPGEVVPWTRVARLAEVTSRRTVSAVDPRRAAGKHVSKLRARLPGHFHILAGSSDAPGSADGWWLHPCVAGKRVKPAAMVNELREQELRREIRERQIELSRLVLARYGHPDVENVPVPGRSRD